MLNRIPPLPTEPGYYRYAASGMFYLDDLGDWYDVTENYRKYSANTIPRDLVRQIDVKDADTMPIADGQVHATLALVEQQRTANIIAAIDKWGGEPGSWPFAIREGLGITTDEVT